MLNSVRQIITPPYSPKDLVSIFLALFIILVIPLTVIQVNQSNDNRAQADSTTFTTLKVGFPYLQTNATFSKTAELVALAEDSSGTKIESLSFTVDGKSKTLVTNQNSTNIFTTTINWDTTKTTSGSHNLTLSTRNSKGEIVTSKPYPVIVENIDQENPIISFISPTNNAYVSGTVVLVKLSASDNLGVKQVTLTIDGKEVQTFTSEPFRYNWDLTKVTAGTHQLSATAEDFSSNRTTAQIKVYRGVSDLKD